MSIAAPHRPPLGARPRRAGAAPVQVAVVVPVHQEQATLEASIRRLHAFLSDGFPFSWRITIADNASTDATLAIAAALARSLAGVSLLRVDEKGRGRALRAAWLSSDADVVAYMDVDLSTDLRALMPLVAPLLSGHSDVAIGSRLAPGARVERGPKREFISRAYNVILRGALRARFSDAQCGFKAVRRDVAARLVPDIRDEGWFFDTELLVLAQRRGLRIHEVPVDWVDDPDSRVDIVATALTDLRGVLRLLGGSEVARFLAIGVLSTVAYALLFVLLRGSLGSPAANADALAVTGVANTQANRRVTFRLRGRARLLSDHLRGFAVFILALAISDAALSALHAVAARPPRGVELAVLVIAGFGATVTRFVALKVWVFRRARRTPGPTHLLNATNQEV